VLVVGGTRGVGFGVAQACSRAGAHVTLVGRSPQSDQQALKTLGDNASFIQGDIGAVSNAKETVQRIEEFVSKGDENKFDYLVVSAAIFPDWSGTRPHQNLFAVAWAATSDIRT
jgi:NAD(P)-dependent dehydrogenase (short-subunit alcohol dehydrogenase family)